MANLRTILRFMKFILINQEVPAVNTTGESTDFTPAEIGAMRYAYRQMREDFPDRYIGESEKHELARSILEALGRRVTREGEEKVINLLMKE